MYLRLIVIIIFKKTFFVISCNVIYDKNGTFNKLYDVLMYRSLAIKYLFTFYLTIVKKKLPFLLHLLRYIFKNKCM